MAFVENRGYNIRQVGEALNEALANYMYGSGIDRPVHKWFAGKVPPATVDATLVADQLIKPDAARLYNEKARIIWIGLLPERSEEGIALYGASGAKVVRFKPHETAFLLRIMSLAADLSQTVTFGQASKLFGTYSDESFVAFYLSKKWDILRSFGLLQV